MERNLWYFELQQLETTFLPTMSIRYLNFDPPQTAAVKRQILSRAGKLCIVLQTVLASCLLPEFQKKNLQDTHNGKETEITSVICGVWDRLPKTYGVDHREPVLKIQCQVSNVVQKNLQNENKSICLQIQVHRCPILRQIAGLQAACYAAILTSILKNSKNGEKITQEDVMVHQLSVSVFTVVTLR